MILNGQRQVSGVCVCIWWQNTPKFFYYFFSGINMDWIGFKKKYKNGKRADDSHFVW